MRNLNWKKCRTSTPPLAEKMSDIVRIYTAICFPSLPLHPCIDERSGVMDISGIEFGNI